jgi:formylglycine-generating enzyme required for sulfatase activity
MAFTPQNLREVTFPALARIDYGQMVEPRYRDWSRSGGVYILRMMMRRGLAILLTLAAGHVAGCSGDAFKPDASSGSSESDSGSGGAADAPAAGTSSRGGSHTAGGVHSGGNAGATNMGGVSEGGAAGEIGEGGAAGQVDECPCHAPTPSCEEQKCVSRGPRMLKAGSFYIDTTEVTGTQYAAFLKAKGADTSKQAHQCLWNSSFEPATSPMGQATLSDKPVTNIDYCDAVAYCAWADKRLCGKIGGGPVSFVELASTDKSQWFAACGGPQGQPYPYGTTHQNGACNDATGVAKVTLAGASPQCQGFYPGLMDMLGNVAEWVDACDANSGAGDGCETIGGSYTDTPTCSFSSLKHRNEQLPNVGFRCCAD